MNAADAADTVKRLAAKVLEERLAATLYDQTPLSKMVCGWLAKYAPKVLPDLLSEPDLVAGLPKSVRAAVFRQLLVERLGELSDPNDKPWPFVDFPSVPSGRAGMTVPVFGLLAVLTPDGDT